MSILRVSYGGESLKNLSAEKHALHEKYALPKVPDDLFGVYEYTFGSNPGTGTITLFEIDHDLGYVPNAQMMINIDGTDYYVPLTDFYLYFCNDFEVVPPFRYIDRRILIKARVTSSKITVSLVKTSAGTYTTGGCTFPNLNGNVYNFKFLIFLEGHEDDDVINITL